MVWTNIAVLSDHSYKSLEAYRSVAWLFARTHKVNLLQCCQIIHKNPLKFTYCGVARLFAQIPWSLLRCCQIARINSSKFAYVIVQYPKHPGTIFVVWSKAGSTQGCKADEGATNAVPSFSQFVVLAHGGNRRAVSINYCTPPIVITYRLPGITLSLCRGKILASRRFPDAYNSSTHF